MRDHSSLTLSLGSSSFCPAFLLTVIWSHQPPLLNHTKHVSHVLHHDSGDGGDCVDVMFGVVGEADAGHEVEIFENSVQALTDAGVKIAQCGIGVDEQDRVVGGGVGHWYVVAQR